MGLATAMGLYLAVLVVTAFLKMGVTKEDSRIVGPGQLHGTITAGKAPASEEVKEPQVLRGAVHSVTALRCSQDLQLPCRCVGPQSSLNLSQADEVFTAVNRCRWLCCVHSWQA